MLHLPFPMLLALLLILAAHSVAAGPSKKGDWRQLSTGKTLSEAFGNEIYSWDSDVNWDACNHKTNRVRVRPRSRGRDNGKKISRAVKRVGRMKGGGVVILSKGVFSISSTITMESNVCLRGQGRSKTILKVSKRKADVDNGVVRASYRKYVTLADLSIDGGQVIKKWNSNAKRVKFGINLHCTNFAYMNRVDVMGFSKSGCKCCFSSFPLPSAHSSALRH